MLVSNGVDEQEIIAVLTRRLAIGARCPGKVQYPVPAIQVRKQPARHPGGSLPGFG